MGSRPNARGEGSWVGILSPVIYQLWELRQLINLFEPHCHPLKNKDTLIYSGKLLPSFHQASAPAALYQGLSFAGTFSWSPSLKPARQGLLLT